MTYRKKLIEVALPLEAINKESSREKSIRHGHPSTLHLWWARRPLAACRAVLFASLVDDPSSHPEKFSTEEEQDRERQRLFDIIEQLVKWENSNNEAVLKQAREEIMKSTGGNAPPVLDPFCGGGSIPLEAQRLGLEAHASDLNPVAVLITKALIEIPPKFANLSPIHPVEAGTKELFAKQWRGAEGLAEDVRYYGRWMRDRAEKRIGHLYPKVTLPKEQGGGEATVIAWLWARTVKCPNPACGATMPLVRSFQLSTKKGKEAWVKPIVDTTATEPKVRFEIASKEDGNPVEGTVNRRGARCIACASPVPFDYVRSEGRAGRMKAQLMAIVAEGKNDRIYLSPLEEQEAVANEAKPLWKPEAELAKNPRDFKTPNYGMRTFAELFTNRQLVALTTFSDLVTEARERVLEDAIKAGMTDDGEGIDEGGRGATAYADAVATYLAFAVDKGANLWSSISSWMSDRGAMRETFARQAIPMVWDYAEANPLGNSGGNFVMFCERIIACLQAAHTRFNGFTKQVGASKGDKHITGKYVCSTDPPYYDNIGYADLSDFFYVWLRRSIGALYPIFSTLLVPKDEELVVTPHRFGGDKQKAQEFFEEGLGKAFSKMREVQNQDFPLTVYYAFKQSEEEESDIESKSKSNKESSRSSTGWETMLEGLIKAGFSINGTWPMKTESKGRAVAHNTNALASSIVLVCRARPETAAVATRREFLYALKKELPNALRALQHGNIAPVDLAQAAIGPGMSIFSRYSKVVESDGSPMSVKVALQLINQTLDEVLSEQESEYDADTRWALAWYEQFGINEGSYGDAETLSKAKNTSVDGMVEAGIVVSRSGKVRLLKREELPEDWSPSTDNRLTVWEVTQHLIQILSQKGEQGAAQLLTKIEKQSSSLGEIARDLAYRLYTTSEKKKWSEEARSYNSLVVSWPEIKRLTSQFEGSAPEQKNLF